jgi:hypothetical protein
MISNKCVPSRKSTVMMNRAFRGLSLVNPQPVMRKRATVVFSKTFEDIAFVYHSLCSECCSGVAWFWRAD